MALTKEQIAELDIASARKAAGNAGGAIAGTKQAGDIANIDYATKKLGYVYDPNRKKNTGTGTGTDTKTSGDIYKGLVPGLTADEQAAYDRQKTILDADVTPIDEEAIRKKKLDEMQAEIDALNVVYAGKRKEAEREGLGRLGSSSAIQARRGLIGSDFGNAQTDATQAANQDVYDAIDAEKNAKISNIMAAARNAAQQEIQSKVEARRKGAESYITFLSEAATRKKQRASDAIKNILLQKLTPTDSDLQTIADAVGIPVGELKSQYLADKAANDALIATKTAEQAKKQAEADKAAGKLTTKDLFDKGYTYVTTIPERDRLAKLGYEKYIQDGKTYMKPGKVTIKTVKVGSGKTGQTFQITYDQYGRELSREQIGSKNSTVLNNTNPTPKPKNVTKAMEDKVNKYFTSFKGSDNKVSPDDWSAAKSAWITDGGNPTTFDTKFKGWKNKDNPNYK